MYLSAFRLEVLMIANWFAVQTEKRDALISIEKKYQQIWEEDGVFQPDAPSISDIPLHSITAAELREKYPKFFGTIAYRQSSPNSIFRGGCLPLL